MAVATSCLAIAFPACVVHEVDLSPAPALVAEESVENTIASSTPLWWESFENELLDSLISDSLKKNPDIRSLAHRIDQANARLIQAGSTLFPQLNAVAGFETSRNRNARFHRRDLAPHSGLAPDCRRFRESFEVVNKIVILPLPFISHERFSGPSKKHAEKLFLPASLELYRILFAIHKRTSRMKKPSLLAILLPLLFLAACGSKPKNLIYSGMTTSRLVEKYGEPVRKKALEDGSETWFYKAKQYVDSASQVEWNTDTASPDFRANHSSPGSPSDGTSFSVSRTMTEETVGIQVRDGEVTKAAPDNLKILGSP